MKILVAEDSGLIRRAITKVAKELGYETLEAENGAECLAALNQEVTDIKLVVLDWNMPVMDGYEALTKIRSNKDFDHVKILMATADGVDSDVIKAIKAGADSYLVKPFSPEKLATRIRELL